MSDLIWIGLFCFVIVGFALNLAMALCLRGLIMELKDKIDALTKAVAEQKTQQGAQGALLQSLLNETRSQRELIEKLVDGLCDALGVDTQPAPGARATPERARPPRSLPSQVRSPGVGSRK